MDLYSMMDLVDKLNEKMDLFASRARDVDLARDRVLGRCRCREELDLDLDKVEKQVIEEFYRELLKGSMFYLLADLAQDLLEDENKP